jgi:hypothetical protein
VLLEDLQYLFLITFFLILELGTEYPLSFNNIFILTLSSSVISLSLPTAKVLISLSNRVLFVFVGVTGSSISLFEGVSNAG